MLTFEAFAEMSCIQGSVAEILEKAIVRCKRYV